jgi:porin
MRNLNLLLALAGLLGCFTMATATADEQEAGSSGSRSGSAISSDPVDPSNFQKHIQERNAQRDSFFGVSPLKSVHDAVNTSRDKTYKATHLKMGLAINHLFQGLSDALPDHDKSGTATDMDIYGTWELAKRGKPNQGNFYFKIQGRWDYGTTGPQDLGFVSLASQVGTANTFSAYTPTFLLRNVYWEQGTKQAGKAYRVGKISTDAILATSRHISPVTTFLPNGGTGLFVSGYSDSGLGAVGVWYPSDRYRILGLVSDANGDRHNFGDISAGDLYTALEFGTKIAPRTEKAGYSKFTFWHNDGTKDGKPINASTGKEGYGMTVKLEHEFTGDGKTVGVFRWGKAWNKSALYDEQAAVHLLFYDPPGPARLQNDLVGLAVNWALASAAGARGEYNLEAFYRFPFFTGLDTTLSYQYVYHPALTREIDHASVLSFRLRAVF